MCRQIKAGLAIMFSMNVVGWRARPWASLFYVLCMEHIIALSFGSKCVLTCLCIANSADAVLLFCVLYSGSDKKSFYIPLRPFFIVWTAVSPFIKPLEAQWCRTERTSYGSIWFSWINLNYSATRNTWNMCCNDLSQLEIWMCLSELLFALNALTQRPRLLYT